MSNKCIAKIKLSDIAKLELYVNSGHKTIAQIKQATGADYIMNAGFFNWNWTPVPLLKVNGKMLSSTPWSDWGFGWNTNDIVMTSDYKSYQNFISGICLANPMDGTNMQLKYNSDVGGSRGRSAVGLTNDSLVMLCTKDGSSYNMTPEQVRTEMLGYGCKKIVMFDGGGSSSCDFLGDTVTTSRIVYDLILVYLKKSASPTGDATIKAIQSELNAKYGFGLNANGVWDATSKKAMIKAVQTEINNLYGGKLAVDGSWGPASKKACPNIKKVTKNALAWLVQACLIIKGYTLVLDSSYGPSCYNAIKDFQKKNGLFADGVCGPSTFTKLLA